MANQPPPLARRIELGVLLRNYRERAGWEVSAVANALGWSYVQKVGLVEGGKRKLVPAEIMVLADLYDLTPEERDKAIALGKEARKVDPGPAYVADYAQTFVALESAAAHIRLYSEELLPGLVQTDEYAHELLALGTPLTGRRLEAAADQRAERQRLLLGPEAPRLTYVLSESGLRRMPGGSEVERGQLEHLRQLAGYPNVTLRILPFETGTHPATGTGFGLIEVGDSAVTFAYVEAFTDAEIYDRSPHTDLYTLAFERVERAALSPAKSRARLDQMIADLDRMEH